MKDLAWCLLLLHLKKSNEQSELILWICIVSLQISFLRKFALHHVTT